MRLECPNCGNFPKRELSFFFSACIPPFRCYHCYHPLRGSALMILLDLVGFLGGIASIAFLFSLAIGPTPFLAPEEAFVGSAFAAVSIRLSVQWIQMRVGRYVRIKHHAHHRSPHTSTAGH